MTFSEKVKNEIISKFNKTPCCMVASLSAFVRGSGTIASSGGYVGFETVTENKNANDLYREILISLYEAK